MAVEWPGSEGAGCLCSSRKFGNYSFWKRRETRAITIKDTIKDYNNFVLRLAKVPCETSAGAMLAPNLILRAHRLRQLQVMYSRHSMSGHTQD